MALVMLEDPVNRIAAGNVSATAFVIVVILFAMYICPVGGPVKVKVPTLAAPPKVIEGLVAVVVVKVNVRASPFTGPNAIVEVPALIVKLVAPLKVIVPPLNAMALFVELSVVKAPALNVIACPAVAV